MGERTPLALLERAGLGPHGGGRGDHQPGGRRTIGDIGRIKLSANWMAAAGHGSEDAALFDTVKAVGLEFCPSLGVSHSGRQGFAVDADHAGRKTAGRNR